MQAMISLLLLLIIIQNINIKSGEIQNESAF